jgi:hypothetical protein
LGKTKLSRFTDQRLYDFWTTTPLPEKVWVVDSSDAAGKADTRNATVWDMGNK